MFSGFSDSEHYAKIKASYRDYLKTYQTINNGSLAGAVNFFEFYHYLTYTCRYADPRACVPIGYR